mmetsp:Transcript_71067/g.153171  ORF Transcript_71067/g.153171 Transcript_71067/m.153171 type:complete len:128 (+) Transcript_71067:653-1036(+)
MTINGRTVGSNSDSFTIADSEEVWVVHVFPSDNTGMNSAWVAKKVPEGHAVAVTNVFIIREVDFNDSHNFRWSDNLVEVAKVWGWDPATQFDFCSIFSSGEYGGVHGSGRRLWRIQDTFRPDLNLSP